jgi:hypothetical protein
VTITYTDDTIQKIRDSYSQLGNAQKVSRELNIPPTTVRRFCRDLEKKTTGLTDDMVKDLRTKAANDPLFNLRVWARESHFDLRNYSFRSLEKALKGQSFKHLDATHSPVDTVSEYDLLREKARELYRQGYSYDKIKAQLRVSKSSLSLWCRDLNDTPPTTPKRHLSDEFIKKMRELYQGGMSVIDLSRQLKISDKKISEHCGDLILARKENRTATKKPRKKTVRVANGCQVLKDDDVIAMRREIRASGKKAWKIYAEKYKISIATISVAVRGKTFTHLNAIEPPIEDHEVIKTQRPALVDRTPASPELAQQALAKRRSDPLEWTYGKIAQWLSEVTGKKYRAGHVKILLVNKDPTIVQLEAIKAPKPPKPFKVKPYKRRAPRVTPHLTQAEQARRAALAREREEEKAIQKLIEEEERFEAWVNAGRPT